MVGELLYFGAIASFGFVILGAAQFPSGMWLVMSLFPVFLSLVLGGMLWIVALQEFSLLVSVGSLAVSIAGALAVRRWPERNLFIAICAVGLVGMAFAGTAIHTVVLE